MSAELVEIPSPDALMALVNALALNRRVYNPLTHANTYNNGYQRIVVEKENSVHWVGRTCQILPSV